jgi:hypothetical protein
MYYDGSERTKGYYPQIHNRNHAVLVPLREDHLKGPLHQRVLLLSHPVQSRAACCTNARDIPQLLICCILIVQGCWVVRASDFGDCPPHNRTAAALSTACICVPPVHQGPHLKTRAETVSAAARHISTIDTWVRTSALVHIRTSASCISDAPNNLLLTKRPLR